MSGTTIASGARRRTLGATCFALTTAAVLMATGSAAAAAPPATQPSGAAPGGPGAQSYLDVARKDCFGTARNTTSKVWFTVAGGVLSDVFSPNIEATNVNTVQYIVTDGHSFADLQQRNMTYSLASPDRSGMVCQVTSTDKAHGFRLISDYITDPARASVLVHTTLQPIGGDANAVSKYKVYVRYDATIDNSGGGGTTNGGANDATVDPSSTALVSSDTNAPTGPFAAQVVGALVANRPFLAESSGFVGTPSDGLDQLDTHHQLVNDYRSAMDGNVVQTALLDTTPGQPFTLALGFAPTAGAAVSTAQTSAAQPFAHALSQYEAGWHDYDASLKRPPATLLGFSGAQNGAMQRTYWLSANVIKAAEDKTNIGAFVASPTDPWGQTVPATTTHAGWTYREVFARDSYETFTGLLADGDRASARDMVMFMFDKTQQPDGSFPRDSELDGAVAPDTFGLSEIDEVAYPLLMAQEAGLAGNTAFYQDHIRPAADYIVDHGPSTGAERWEEHPGYSPATIAAEIAGLTAAAQLAQAAGDGARAHLYQSTADDYQRNVKAWTVTTSGPDGPRYFIRESVSGNPNTDQTYNLGNGSLNNVDQRSIIDAGFLELTRMGELSATDPDVKASLKVVDSVLESQTASGPGWHRYGIKAKGSTDGYGDCYVPDPTSCSPTGEGWFPNAVGSGHLWPLLDGERAEQDLQAGQTAAASSLAATFQRMTWGLGYVPEQVWEDPNTPASPFGANPTTASIGFTNGKAAGSAAPLIWGQAQYLRLVLDLHRGKLSDQPAVVRARYLSPGAPADVPVTLTAPSNGAMTTGSTTTVTGTTTPGATVEVSSGQPGSTSNTTTVVATTADAKGAFSATVPTPSGSDVITAATSTGARATGWAQVTVTGSA
ncbi:MAG TPA: glycoside hydrolase family 15 protein [Solirubrobacteraceae bacterium]|nr:glycoside hydrolase family 15 protein [Solirubrobacteraceae bacterium]